MWEFLNITWLSINIKGGRPERRVYKLVLTGGPCGGKTTGQSKLATFFESIGWKVIHATTFSVVILRWVQCGLGKLTYVSAITELYLKVFRVPETATVLMSGGIAFGELNEEQVLDFQVTIWFWLSYTVSKPYIIPIIEICTLLYRYQYFGMYGRWNTFEIGNERLL